jgi:hypothetical protein
MKADGPKSDAGIGGQERFSELVLRELQPVLGSVIERDENQQPHARGPRERWLSDVFNGWLEINTSRKGLEMLAKLIKVLRMYFKPLTHARGTHVHKARFFDSEITEAEGTELAAGIVPDADRCEMWTRLARMRCRRLREKWSKRLSGKNAEIDRILDAYFKSLLPVVFDGSGQLTTPSGGVSTEKRDNGRG